MKKVFDEVNSLDRRCYEEFSLNEDILMEQAASSIEKFIRKKFKKNSSILIVSGSGNNGADGITLARLLYGDYDITLFIPNGVKSDMAKLQLQRLEYIHNIYKDKKFQIFNSQFSIFNSQLVIVDCLFGSGLNRELNKNSTTIINYINNLKGYKIACDIPSGIDTKGYPNKVAFIADTTITMGALKKALFGDMAKDYVGKIIVSNLGVSREIYENDSNCFLIEKSDIKLPYRTKQNTHKGSFGHLAVISGEKSGAAKLCAKSGFETGVGLISIVGKTKNISCEIMSSKILPLNTTAIALGMGLGKKIKKEFIDNDIPKVVDADIFYNKKALKILLKQKNIIFTPHPKEFCSLLKLTNIASIDIETLQKDRFFYLEQFCKIYPNIVVVLKGSNTLIGYADKIYINRFGSSKLSFGGSGDVLAGIISSLLAQGYSIIDAAISGVVIHSLAAKRYKKASFSLTPKKLIRQLKKL